MLGIVKEDQNLSKAYYDKLSDIIEFMLCNRLLDFYENYAGGINADVVKENLGVPMIDLDMHQIIAEIKKISLTVTENTYNTRLQQGYELLLRLRDLGIEQDNVYQLLLQYHNSLADNLSQDFIADILDYVIGWCSPQYRIWET